ncbi:MAG TPA: hypothetical protein ENH82_16645 [bacterium]|nr:hypothetical protein [bacterium]
MNKPKKSRAVQSRPPYYGSMAWNSEGFGIADNYYGILYDERLCGNWPGKASHTPISTSSKEKAIT